MVFRGAGNNRAVSTATASSFLNAGTAGAAWSAMIASWLAPPAIGHHDDESAISIDEILQHLEPSA